MTHLVTRGSGVLVPESPRPANKRDRDQGRSGRNLEALVDRDGLVLVRQLTNPSELGVGMRSLVARRLQQKLKPAQAYS